MELRTVLHSSYIHQIHLAKSKLESEGIGSFIEDENLNSAIGAAFGGAYKLLVEATDFDKALSLINLYKT